MAQALPQNSTLEHGGCLGLAIGSSTNNQLQGELIFHMSHVVGV